VRGPLNFFQWVLVAAALAVGGTTASAYNTVKDKSKVYVVVWDPGTVNMLIKLPTPSSPLIDGSTSYSAPVQTAMLSWNNISGVVKLGSQVQASGRNTSGNGLNEIVMATKVDGEAFGENTLAVTTSYSLGNTRTEADIIFNTAYTWDSYRGSLRSGRSDIQRIAIHELGHVLGLVHPDEAQPPQVVSAIMNSRVSNVETPEPDDINGMQSLYGAPGFIPANNNFANALPLTDDGSTGQATGTNIAATAQVGEPDHDTETARRSIWWRWTATGSAPVTLTTFGSNFDTVLGVYTGSALDALAKVVSNDDESRGVIRTSKLSFTPAAGVTYHFAVDGWDGSYGQVTLNLTLGQSTGIAPTITSSPSSRSVTTGGSVTLNVVATGSPSGYQWYFNGSPRTGATGSTLTINNVTSTNAGSYYATATNAAGSATSTAASLTVTQPTVTTQVVTRGHDASLSAPSANGTYQWQVSTDNGATWSSLVSNSTYSGVFSSTLTISAAGSSLNGARYRYIMSDPGSTATSEAISLRVVAALIPFPVAIAVDGSGNLYVGDSSVHTVHKITTTNQVSTLAGTSGQAGTADGTGATARFNQPSGLTVTSAGVLTVADTANAVIRRITTAGVVTTLAGSTTTRGNADGAGASATFAMPIGITQTSGGTITVADATNHTLRQISSASVVSTIAGSAGSAGAADGAGPLARFNYPTGVAVDGSGNVYVADTTNNLIRKITAGSVVTTLAGVVGVSGADDGTGSAALFNQPGGLAVDSAGNLYVADTANSVIRKVSPLGVVTTLAGLPTVGGLKDGTGSDAWFNQPRSLTVDASGFVYVADTGNAAIRKITPGGIVTTLALTEAPANTGGGGSSGGGTPPPPPTPSTGGGGGGGGGAPSPWFVGALSLLVLARWCRLRFK